MFKLSTLVCCVLVTASFSGAENLPDPTQPLEHNGTRPEVQQLKLDSVLISGSRKIAVINGVQVIEDQWLGDKQVVRIQANQVTLNHQGQVIVLSLFGKTIRQ